MAAEVFSAASWTSRGPNRCAPIERDPLRQDHTISPP
jgi:hypothetical protein